jgi:hypothetical protein
MWMKDRSKMSPQVISRGIAAAISLRALPAGTMPLLSRAGSRTAPYGPGPAPANLSARQAKELGLLTSGTSGPHGSISLQSAILRHLLASRLRARLGSRGSTLFTLIWRERVTPSGRLIYRLAASGRRTSGNGSTSWPTPQSHDERKRGNTMADHHHFPHDLSNAVEMTSWPTTKRDDGIKSIRSPEGALKEYQRKGVNDLTVAAVLASWGSPTAEDGRRGTRPPRPWDTGVPLSQQVAWATPRAEERSQYNSRDKYQALSLQVKQAARISPQSRGYKGDPETPRARGRALPHQASGTRSSGSPVGTAKPGQLSPAFSLWLMGFPFAWVRAAGNAIVPPLAAEFILAYLNHEEEAL